jgi:hypothetical protein
MRQISDPGQSGPDGAMRRPPAETAAKRLNPAPLLGKFVDL